MTTIQFAPGASVDDKLNALAEFVGASIDAIGQEQFASALEARKAARAAAAEAEAKAKAEAEKAAAAVPAKLKRGKRK